MININLAPEHLRKKSESGLLGVDLHLPREVVAGTAFGLFALLLITHVGLQAFITMKYLQHNAFKKEWEDLQPNKAIVDGLLTQLKQKQAKFKSIEQVIGGTGIVWSSKLQRISEDLPHGVWLNRLALEDEALVLQGSAVSKNDTEMIDVHKLTTNLKEDDGFSADFANVELGLIKSRTIVETPIADFNIRAQLP